MHFLNANSVNWAINNGYGHANTHFILKNKIDIKMAKKNDAMYKIHRT